MVAAGTACLRCMAPSDSRRRIVGVAQRAWQRRRRRASRPVGARTSVRRRLVHVEGEGFCILARRLSGRSRAATARRPSKRASFRRARSTKLVAVVPVPMMPQRIFAPRWRSHHGEVQKASNVARMRRTSSRWETVRSSSGTFDRILSREKTPAASHPFSHPSTADDAALPHLDADGEICSAHAKHGPFTSMAEAWALHMPRAAPPGMRRRHSTVGITTAGDRYRPPQPRPRRA